jgi:APA family basic amino acid/polyamine antiporter
MAQDGVFFRRVAAVHPRTRVPVVAIVLQGTVAGLLALTGSYERILGYVVSIDWLFFGLTALALLAFRRQDRGDAARPTISVPGHPWTTLAFVAGAWLIVANTIVRFPADALAGMALLVAGIPVYLFWQRRG